MWQDLASSNVAGRKHEEGNVDGAISPFDDGDVAISIQCADKPAHAEPDDPIPMSELVSVQEIWLHVALHYCSPCRPTFRLLANPRRTEADTIELDAAHVYMTLLEAARDIYVDADEFVCTP